MVALTCWVLYGFVVCCLYKAPTWICVGGLLEVAGVGVLGCQVYGGFGVQRSGILGLGLGISGSSS